MDNKKKSSISFGYIFLFFMSIGFIIAGGFTLYIGIVKPEDFCEAKGTNCTDFPFIPFSIVYIGIGIFLLFMWLSITLGPKIALHRFNKQMNKINDGK